MLNRDEALRLVFEDTRASWGCPCLVTDIWGDEEKFVVWIEPASWPLEPVIGNAPVIVHRSNGRLEHPGSAVPPDTYTQGLSRIAWKPYRPVDPTISSTRIRKCRRCGGRLVPIIWGYPGPDLFEESTRGTVALGGCVLPTPGEPHPVKACRACGWELSVEPNRPP